MNYVSAREGVPVPTVPYNRAGRAEWVVCGMCPWRGRPGGFHVCIDLTTPEREAARVSPKYALAAKRAEEGARLYVGGATIHEIAVILGMSYSGVQKMLAQNGVPRRPQGRTRKRSA